MNAIIGFSDVIAAGASDSSGTQHHSAHAEKILAAGKNLEMLFDKVLEISRLEDNALGLDMVEIGLEQVLEPCIAAAESQARKTERSFNLSLPSQTVVLRADFGVLSRALMLLLDNAFKYTEPGGNVDLLVEANPIAGVTFTISDDGVGIDAHDLDIALTHFGRVENDLNGNSDGSGLGLPLARGLVSALGGSTMIKSEPGSGTTVHVHMPAEMLISA